MNQPVDLQRKAREAVQDGVMPLRRPEQTWGGPGDGLACAICGTPTSPDEMAFDLEFAVVGAEPHTYQVHPRCFALWETERDKARGKDAATMSESSGSVCCTSASGAHPIASNDLPAKHPGTTMPHGLHSSEKRE